MGDPIYRAPAPMPEEQLADMYGLPWLDEQIEAAFTRAAASAAEREVTR